MSSVPASPYEALKSGFRRACVRRLVGDDKAAVSILRDEIPKLVVSWAKTSNLDASEKKSKLKELFDDESARADELATAFDLFAARFEVRVASLVKSEVSSISEKLSGVVQSLSGLTKAELPREESLATKELLVETNVNEESFPDKDSSPPVTSTKNKITGADPEKQFQFEHPDNPEEIDVPTEPEESMVGEGLRFDEIEEMIDEILLSPN